MPGGRSPLFQLLPPVNLKIIGGVDMMKLKMVVAFGGACCLGDSK